MPLGRAAMRGAERLARPRSSRRAALVAEQSERLPHRRAGVRRPAARRPPASASRVASAKLNMCGPTITGAPAASASIRFWPPSGANEPPITATSHAA